jgi:hypothetical protein
MLQLYEEDMYPRLELVLQPLGIARMRWDGMVFANLLRCSSTGSPGHLALDPDVAPHGSQEWWEEKTARGRAMVAGSSAGCTAVHSPMSAPFER